MSWIVDLAGKAENLLNNIDQSAAGAIQLTPEKSKLQLESQNVKTQSDNNKTIKGDSSATQQNVSKNLFQEQSITRQAKNFTKKKSNKKDNESELFDFLNSSNRLPSTKAKLPENKSKSSTKPTKNVNLSDMSRTKKPSENSPTQRPSGLEISRSSHDLNADTDSLTSKQQSNSSDFGSTSSETGAVNYYKKLFLLFKYD